MKNYLAEMVDLTGNSYLNPSGAAYGDGSGTHQRGIGNIRSISVHHDASPRPHDYDSVARYMQEAREHYNRLGPGLQYHYKIDNTGVIFRIRPLTTWLYVVGSAENTSCIAICLDGNFEGVQQPTREQYEALSQLLVNLCEQHPEFPATYPDVRPHADYSATACCGSALRPYVYGIQDKASCLNIPNVAYDWPELQPALPVPAPQPAPAPAPTPAPVPTPAPTVESITYENIISAAYIAQVKTHLDDAATGARVKDYDPGTEFTFTRRMRKGDQTWLQTPYSVEKTPTRGIPEKDVVLKNTGTNPTPPSDPGTLPVPPLPTTPPEPAPQDQGHDFGKENNDLLKQILAIVQAIITKLATVFK